MTNRFRIALRQALIYVLVVSGIVALGLLVLSRGIENSKNNIFRSVHLSSAFNAAVIPTYWPQKSFAAEMPYGERSGCATTGKPKWYDDQDFSLCLLMSSTQQANSFCSFFNIGTTCLGIAIPKKYMDYTYTRRQVMALLAAPCVVLGYRLGAAPNPAAVTIYEGLLQRIGCVDGEFEAEFNIHLIVIAEDWDSLARGEDGTIIEHYYSTSKSLKILTNRHVN